MKEVRDVVLDEEGIDLDNFELLEDEEEVQQLRIEQLKKDGKIRLHGEDFFELAVEESTADETDTFEVVDE